MLYIAVTLGSILSYRNVCWSDPGYANPENCDDLAEIENVEGQGYAHVAPEEELEEEEEGLEQREAHNRDLEAGDDDGITIMREEGKGTSTDHESIKADLKGPAQLYEEEGRRWCKFCKLFQPLRSKHCLECRKCCAKYDHHCFWLGTCVGERNHGKFWWYLFFQSIEVVWAFIVAQSAFKRNNKFDHSWGSWWHNNAFVFSINIFLVAFVWFPTGLLVTPDVLDSYLP